MTAAVEGGSHAAPTAAQTHVTAVLVSHDGSRWLPHGLDGLLGQTRPPDETVAVDTGSRDDSYDVLTRRLGKAAVVAAPPRTSMGAAVDVALLSHPARHLPEDPARSWLWLLHDDCAPAPDALATLLREVAQAPDVGVVGPKLREWPSLRRLLEVGVTITGTGRRETGLEPGEPDQGQHDRTRDVLAVSSAGMLVRRDVWSALAGFDPRLPLFGDDVDFGWRANRAGYRVRVVPTAVVFHAEASARGLRGTGAPRARRRAAVYTLLANASGPGLCWQYPRLLLGSVLRVLALLLVKASGQAWAELRGTLDVYLRPWRLFQARRARRRTAQRPQAEVRPLLPHPTLPYRHGADTVLELARALLLPAGAAPAGRRVQRSEPGPVAAEAEDLPAEDGLLVRLARHPWASAVVVLTLLAMWAGAGLLGSGLLQGGALLPAPDSVGRWWSLLWESWHPVGVGSAEQAPPYVLVLALAGSVLGGQPWLLVDLLLLGAVPLCALTAHRLARRLFVSRRVQIWWAVTYGMVPVVTGAVGQGRIGTVVGAIVLPAVGGAALRLVLPRPGAPAWQQAVRLGLWLSLLVGFVPVAYPLLVAVIVACAALALRGWRWLALVAALVLPTALLGPWLWSRWPDPGLFWWEAGLPDAGTGRLAPDVHSLLAGVPGGAVHAPAVIGLALLGVAVAGLPRTDRQRALLAAWLVALGGLAAAVAGSGTSIEVPTRDAPVAAWVGFPLVCWWGALALVAALAADGAGGFLARRSFGWRQPFAVAASIVALGVPVAATGWWAWDTGTGDLHRGPATALPDYLAAAASAPVASSTLVLSGSVAHGVTYSLVRDDGTRLGEEAVVPIVTDRAAFDAAVTALLGEPSLQWVSQLADYGVGAVYAPPPVDVAVTGALDSAPGLQRSGAPDTGARAWRLTAGSGSVRVLPEPGASPQQASGLPASRDLVGAVTVGPGSGGHRRLVLAAPADTGWSASGPASALQPASRPSGAQTFALPAETGVVDLEYASARRWWRPAQLALLGLALLAALPGRPRHR